MVTLFSEVQAIAMSMSFLAHRHASAIDSNIAKRTVSNTWFGLEREDSYTHYKPCSIIITLKAIALNSTAPLL